MALDYRGTISPWYQITIAPDHHSTRSPWYLTAMLPDHCGTRSPWYPITVAPDQRDTGCRGTGRPRCWVPWPSGRSSCTVHVTGCTLDGSVPVMALLQLCPRSSLSSAAPTFPVCTLFSFLTVELQSATSASARSSSGHLLRALTLDLCAVLIGGLLNQVCDAFICSPISVFSCFYVKSPFALNTFLHL